MGCGMTFRGRWSVGLRSDNCTLHLYVCTVAHEHESASHPPYSIGTRRSWFTLNCRPLLAKVARWDKSKMTVSTERSDGPRHGAVGAVVTFDGVRVVTGASRSPLARCLRFCVVIYGSYDLHQVDGFRLVGVTS
jgi:hypothetical protein